MKWADFTQFAFYRKLIASTPLRQKEAVIAPSAPQTPIRRKATVIAPSIPDATPEVGAIPLALHAKSRYPNEGIRLRLVHL